MSTEEKLDKVLELLNALDRRMAYLDRCNCLQMYGYSSGRKQEDGFVHCDKCGRLMYDRDGNLETCLSTQKAGAA